MKYLLVATMALALVACGSKTEEEAVSNPVATGSRQASANNSVAAVLESDGRPLAELRFVIDTRPVVGKPFRLQLIASASVPVPQVLLTVESEDLWIDEPNGQFALEEAVSGADPSYRASHDLFLTARNAGLVELVVHLGTGPDTPETLYVIPVLVAKAEPATAAGEPASDKPDPATEDDHGEP